VIRKNKQKQNKNKLHTMKNKIAIASAFLAAASFSTAEIVVNDFLSFEGFVDSSYSHTNLGADADGNENSFGIDQVEISWLFDFDTVTAQVDLEYEGSSRAVSVESDNSAGQTSSGEIDSVNVEQAFVTYHFDNGGAVTAGRYASMLGFEAFEPTGLYQYSTAYEASGLPGYAQGVKYTRESDATFFGISVQDEAFENGGDRLGGNEGDSSYAVEVAGAYDLGNGVAVFLGGAYEDAEAGDSYIVNAYTTFETGAWLFAAEVNFGNSESGAFNILDDAGAVEMGGGNDVDVLSGLLMANYAYNETASVTGRVSYEEVDGTVDGDVTKYTLAHNKALADNLALITEVSFADADLDGSDEEETEFAVELLFTF
jgi:hypothetical protein